MTEIFSEGKDMPINDFWEINTPPKGKPTVTILPDKLIEFCSRKLGFYNYVDYSGNYNLVRVTNKSIIEEAKPEDIKQEIKKYLRNERKQEDVWAAFAQKNWVTEHFRNLLEKVPEINFNVSSKNEAFFFYRNTVVKVSPKGLSFIPYNEFAGTVWKHQIINRDFTPVNEFEKAVFNQFLKNVSGCDKSRYRSLISILGYLLHPYKDPSFTKAIMLIDEYIDFTGLAFGGTGKSIIGKALEQITPTVWKDGKKFNPNEVFVFDDIRPYHRLLYFDDVKRNFPFEEFYSLITGNLKINRKYRDSSLIPFQLSPKLLISSNYMVRGTGGSTDERRRIEFELYPYYSNGKSPKTEFGHIFFDDWDIKEWQLFDMLMVSCVSFFMINGLINPPQINLAENKLKMATDHEFVLFMDGTIQPNSTYDKAVLSDDFKSLCPSQRSLSAISFKKWIDSWAKHRGLFVQHFKSNGRAMVTFLENK